MALLICADAQPQIGTGHLRRMLTWAEALIQQDAQITLQTSALGADIAAASSLDLPIITATCTPQDVAMTLQQDRFDGVILDNYHWTATAETPLRAHVPFIAVVDDLANRAHDADLLLDQNAHHSADDYDHLLPAACTRLVGGDYCLLASPFREDRTPATGTLNAPVFVSLGGGDPHNDLVPITQILLTQTALSLTIATGSHIAEAAALQALADQHPDRVELVFDSPRVADQMQASQFAVAAGGTMTWERAAMGLPSLCLVLADNQADSATWLAARDVHANFDMRPGWDRTAFTAAVQTFAADTAGQQRYAAASRALIARDGAVRAARALLESLHQTPSA